MDPEEKKRINGGRLAGDAGGAAPRFVPRMVGADKTMERRRGRNITASGFYRDIVRSTEKYVVTCFGLKFVERMLPDEMHNTCITDAKQVSSASYRVIVRAMDLEPM